MDTTLMTMTAFFTAVCTAALLAVGVYFAAKWIFGWLYPEEWAAVDAEAGGERITTEKQAADAGEGDAVRKRGQRK